MKLQYHPNVFFTALLQLFPPPIATSPELGGGGCKAVPMGRFVQPCSRCRQVGSLRTGGKE